MPFTFTSWAAKVLDDVFGFQSVNNIRNNELYLKQQSEVLVAQDATAIKTSVVPRDAMAASNSAIEGARLVSRAAASNKQTWEETVSDPMYWID